MSKEIEIIYCQQCRTRNDAEDKYCQKCRARLMVVNWAEEPEDAAIFDSSFLDEHILERVSSLEENVRILSEHLAVVQQKLAALQQHEQDVESLEGQGSSADKAADK